MEYSSNIRADERTIASAQIQNTVQRYAFLARNDLDWVEFSKTLLPEAKIHLANEKTLSLSEWQTILQGEQAKYIRHHLTTMDIQFTSDMEALATAQFFTITDWSHCDHWGEWKFLVTSDGTGAWLIKEKTIILDGVDPAGWAAARYQHS